MTDSRQDCMASRSPYGRDWGRQFAAPVVRGLGGKMTPEKLRFFEAWAQAEGTEARFNPFATTRRGYQGETSFNSVGVKNYVSPQQGIKATIDTLQLNYYTELTNLLKDPNATAEDLAKAVAASPWGTGTGVLRVLGVHSVDGYEKAAATAKYGQSKAQLEGQYSKIDAVSFRPSESYVQQVQQLNPALGRLVANRQPLGSWINKPELMVPSTETTQAGGFTPSVGVVYQGDKMILPTSWKGTHVTDSLGWGTKTASDIMGAAGTPVGAPETGRVVYYHPTGAQGGGSMLIRTKSGREYWLGHIQSDLQEGATFKRGQVIAAISADHPRPHVHIDVRGRRRRRGGK